MRRDSLTEDDLKVFEDNLRKIKGTVGGSLNKAGRAIARPSPGVLLPTPLPLTLALTGQLPSGKNQVQLSFKNGKVHKYPNKTFTNWRSFACLQILDQRDYRLPPLLVPVHLTVEYWHGDARTRDVSGQLDALFHLLVYAKVLKDDGLVHEVTWRRQAINRKFPKVVLTIEVIT